MRKIYLACVATILCVQAIAQNTAINFNGSTFYTLTNSGSGSALDFGSNNFTIEAWVNPTSVAAGSNNFENTIIAKDRGAGSNTFGYALRTGGSRKISFVYGSGTTWNELVTSTAQLTIGQWTHIAVTKNAGLVNIYVNGISVASQTFALSSISNSSNSVLIGESPGFTGRRWNGDLDEIKIWNTTRSATEINTDMAPTCNTSTSYGNLLRYYKMEETSGTTLADASINNNNATLNGTFVNAISTGLISPNVSTLYVDASGNSCNDGLSWATAFISLADALDVAHKTPTITTILVAEGNYKPTYQAYAMNANKIGVRRIDSDIKRSTFHIRAGLTVLGGYPSGGGVRDYINKQTVLRGDELFGNTGDTAYNVVLIDRPANWNNATDTTTLSGFTIINGSGSQVTSLAYSVNGNTVNNRNGAGISIFGARIKITNCIIKNNKALEGSGIAALNLSNAIINNNLLENNIATSLASAVFIDGSNNTICNNVLHDNQHADNGAMLLIGSANYLINNTFYSNKASATNGTGGLYISNPTSPSYVVNNLFYNNLSVGNSTATHSDFRAAGSGAGYAFFINNILQSSTAYSLKAPNFNGGSTGNIFSTVDPFVSTLNNLRGADGLFGNTDDNLQLSASSLAIDAGVNTYNTYCKGIDASNRPRTKYTTTDIGAYEVQIKCANETQLYVDASVTTSGIGTTWPTAYKTFSEALEKAHTCNTIDSIFVAAGTYSPSNKPFEMDINEIGFEKLDGNNANATFHIRKGLRVLGGYPAGGGARYVTNNNTELNGNISTGNVYHVVTLDDPFNWNNSSDSTVLDGFTITGGVANANTSYMLNGSTLNHNTGGAINAFAGFNRISNCIIKANQATASGGAIYTKSGNNIINNNIFEANQAANGGAINTEIGAIQLRNNLIVNNVATGQGGVLFCNSSALKFINNTVANNTASGGGSLRLNSVSFASPLEFANNIFWDNKIGASNTSAGADITSSAPIAAASNMFQLPSSNYTLDTSSYLNTFANNPLFLDEYNNDGIDNTHRTLDDGYRITAGSVAINMGINAANTFGEDLFGSLRIRNNTIDRGCYESTLFAPNSFNTIYVDSSITQSFNGSSWALAFKTLPEAIAASWRDTVVNKILIAKGTYLPTQKAYTHQSNGTGNQMTTSSNRDVTFHLRNGIELYGGYASGGGTRNFITNKTILDGNITGTFSNGAIHTVFIDSNTNWAFANDSIIIDGIDIANGNGFNAGSVSINGTAIPNNAGAGIHINKGLVSIRNCNLYNNKGGVQGAALYAANAQLELSKNYIFGNNSNQNGVAGYFNNSNATITNCVIANNISTNTGGAFYFTNSIINAVHNTIASNTAATSASAFSVNNTTLNASNNIFWNNKANNSFTTSDITSSGTTTLNFTNNSLQLASTAYTFNTNLGNIYTTDPLFKSNTDIDGSDNTIRTSDDGLVITCFSPLLNGLASTVTSADILNNARPLGVGAEIGAYEIDVTAVVVKGNGNLISNGSTSTSTTNHTLLGTAQHLSSITKTFTIDNTNDCALSILSAASTNPNFVIGNLAMGTSIAANSTLSFTVTYSTYNFASASSIISFTSNSPTVPSFSFTVEANGCPGNIKLFVDSASTSTMQNGATWATAFSSLDDAMNIANACNIVDDIWVAKGTYYPNQVLPGRANNNGNKTFYLNNQYNLIGGFTNGDQYTYQRNLASNKTLLNADIDKDGTTANNSRGLLLVAATANTNSTNLIDGFRFENAYSFVQNFSECNAPVECFNEISFTNCNFSNNAGYHSGAIANYTPNQTSITHCSFTNNTGVDATAISSEGVIGLEYCTLENNYSATASTILVSTDLALFKTIFKNNTQTYFTGDAVVLKARNLNASNCIFDYSNSAFNGNNASLIKCNSLNGSNTSQVEHCVFNCPIAISSIINSLSGVLQIESSTFRLHPLTFSISCSNSVVAVYNTILDGSALYENSSALVMGNCIVRSIGNFQTNNASLNSISYSNLYIGSATYQDTASAAGADGVYFTADDGLKLLPSSYDGINGGNNADLNLMVDITGGPRIKNGTTDIGAYETEVCDGSLAVTATANTFLCDLSATTINLNSVGGYGNKNISPNIVVRPAGNYTYTVTDDYGCTATTVISITQPAPITFSTTITHVSCHSTTNGSINISATGGQVSTPTITPNNFNNLAAGTYTYTATDGVGCTKTTTVTITQPNAITLVPVSITNTICIGDTTGAVNFAGGGGVGNYTITPNPTNLAAGNYTFTLTDANYCTGTTTVQIMATGNPTITVSQVFNTCAGNMQVQGAGATSYAYSGGLLNATNFVPIGVNTYTVIGTSSSGCTNSSTFVVDAQNVALTIYVDSSKTLSGNGASWANAVKDLNQAFDQAYSCANAATIYVAKGTYKPTRSGYSANGTPASTINLSDKSISCFFIKDSMKIYGGYPSGGGTRNVQNNITLLSGDVQNTPSITADDVFHLVKSFSNSNSTVLDGLTLSSANPRFAVGGTNIVSTYTLYPYQGGALAAINSSIKINECIISNNTAVNAPGFLFFGGTPTITNCVFTKNTAQTYGPLYMKNVASAIIDNCVITQNTTTNKYPGISLDFCFPTITNTTIANNLDLDANGRGAGIAYLFGSGGTLKNTILYHNYIPNNTSSYTNQHELVSFSLAPNQVQISNCFIRDYNATNTTNVNVQGPISTADPLFIDTNNTIGLDNKWRTADDGLQLQSASTAINAGSTSVTSPVNDITNRVRGAVPFDIGAYEYIVPCMAISSQTIALAGYACGNYSGSISIPFADSNFTYQLINTSGNFGSAVAGTNSILVLNNITNAGTYSVVAIQNTNTSCTVMMTGSVNINAFSPAIITTINQKNVCPGVSNGFAKIIINGGIAPYTYSWQPSNIGGANSDSIYNLSVGIYTITATSNSGCTHTATVQILATPAISISVSLPSLCNVTTTTNATITTSGGTGLITTSPSASNLNINQYYTFTATDALGCTTSTGLQITSIDNQSITIINQNNATCTTNGEVYFKVNNYTSGTISISPNAGTYATTGVGVGLQHQYTNLPAGTYTITVNNNSGCINSSVINIAAAPGLTFNNSILLKPDTCNNSKGSISFAGGANYTISIVPNVGTTIISIPNVDIKNLPASTYTVTIAQGNCSTTSTFIITNFNSIVNPVLTQTGAIICYGGNANISFTASSNLASIASNLINNTAAISPMQVPAGMYTLISTDALGCSASTSLSVTQPPQIMASLTSSNNSPQVGSTITLTALPAGAVNYVIQHPTQILGNSNANINSLYIASLANNGIYTVTITDANNCTASATTALNVQQPNIKLALKVLLSGAYNTSTSLMNDNLRTLSKVPLIEPYGSMNTSHNPYTPVFTHVNGGGGESTTTAILNVGGANAIVDWVFVQLRSKTDSTQVLATRSALLQCDGDVVDVDGTSPLTFTTLNANDYFVSVRHRNHAGIMSSIPITFSNTNPTNVDFTNTSTTLFSRAIPFNNTTPLSGATRVQASKRTLYAGNCNISSVSTSKIITYNSTTASDRAALLGIVGSTGSYSDYSVFDLDLNGTARFNGLAPDRLVLLQNCVNSISIIITEQLP
jgi:hypothetical protein